MNAATTLLKPSRVPDEADGIQINYCKNPTCPNYGVPAINPAPGRKNAKDGYISSGGGTSTQVLKCKFCGDFPPLKSNIGISEELSRMLAELEPENEPSCPDIQCTNNNVPINSGKGHYQSYGITKSGSKRYLCKACKKTFTVAVESTLRQRKADKNELIFSLLMNKSPMNRICEVAQIQPETLYQRINFFYKQCKAFSAHHERSLLQGKAIPRLYVAVDRQEYTVNWTNQSDKRNVILSAVGSADLQTGYVFGMHLDFDPSVDPAAIEADALVRSDPTTAYPFRRYARLWLQSDYYDSVRRLGYGKKRKQATLVSDLSTEVLHTYDAHKNRIDIEAPLSHTFDTSLPKKGMQVHSEYTLYGHFLYLKHLFGGVEKVRFFLDQDSGIRAACLSAFCNEFKERKADAFFVHIKKDLTVNERQHAVADSRKEFESIKRHNPGLTDNEIKILIIQSRISAMKPLGKWKDKWLEHPFPSKSEPDKMVCYLTDYGDYKIDHLANLYSKASLHAIDRFFMQLRRRVSLFERPISTASAQGRAWFGYSPYNPEVVMKMLTIFRVFYNFVERYQDKDKMTPAMRLGMIDHPVSSKEIIGFMPSIGAKP